MVEYVCDTPSAHSQGHRELPHTSPVPSAHTLRIKLEFRSPAGEVPGTTAVAVTC